jgi:ChpA-C
VNKKFAYKTAGTLMVAGMLLSGGPAQAADAVNSQASGDGFVTGNAISPNVDVPLAACGVAAVGGGVATGVCKAHHPLAWTGDDTTKASGEGDGFIAGNAVAADVDVPVAVCGAAGTLAGVATGVCKAHGPLATTGNDTTKAYAEGDGTGTGNAVAIDADVPVAVCGVGVPVLGGVGTGVCKATGPLATTGDDTTKASGEGDGFIAGNAVAIDADVPVAGCGLAGTLGGVATGTCDATGPLATTCNDTTTAKAEGSGTGTGNAVALDLDVPVAACGVGLAILGGVGTGVCN